MNEEISATKTELVNDLLSAVNQNRMLINDIAKLRAEIAGNLMKISSLEKSIAFMKGQVNVFRSQNRELSNELKQSRNIVSKFKKIKEIYRDNSIDEVDRDASVASVLEGMK